MNNKVVYVISCESIRNRYKIGHHSGSKDSLIGRYITSIPDLRVDRFIERSNAPQEEKRLHLLLSKYRMRNINGRKSEWFECTLSEIDKYLYQKDEDKLFSLIYTHSNIKGISILHTNPFSGKIAYKNGIWYNLESIEDLKYRLDSLLLYEGSNIESILSFDVLSQESMDLIKNSSDPRIKARDIILDKLLSSCTGVIPAERFRQAILVSDKENLYELNLQSKLFTPVSISDYITLDKSHVVLSVDNIQKVQKSLLSETNPIDSIFEYWIPNQISREEYRSFCKCCLLGSKYPHPLIVHSTATKGYSLYELIMRCMDRLFGKDSYALFLIDKENSRNSLYKKNYRLIVLSEDSADIYTDDSTSNILIISESKGTDCNTLPGNLNEQRNMFERLDKCVNVITGKEILRPFFLFISWCMSVPLPKEYPLLRSTTRNTANPVKKFIESNTWTGWSPGSVIYEKYREWCSSACIQPVAPNKFKIYASDTIETRRINGYVQYKLKAIL